MGSADGSGRRFTERQIAEILRRAAELQSRSESGGPDDLQSEPDIFQIGSELGLAKGTIEQAIQEFESGHGSRRRRGIWAAPLSEETECTLDAEFDDEAWQELVGRFRKSFGRIGDSSMVGSAREWNGADKVLDPIHFSLVQKDGRSKLVASSDLGPAVFLTCFVGVLLTLVTMLGVLESSLGPVEYRYAAAAAVLGLALIGVRAMLNGLAVRRYDAIRSLFREVERSVAERPDLGQPRIVPSQEEAESPLRQTP